MARKTNGWDDYKRLLLNELEESQQFRKTVRETLTEIRVDIGGLKVKAAVAGGVAGAVGTGVVSMVLAAFK